MIQPIGRVFSVCIYLCFAAAAGQQPPPSTTATVIDRAKIAALLRRALPEESREGGGGLYDGTNYRIGALRRGLPGEVEIHHDDTDIMYVLAGRATLMTGGSVTSRHAISATEERGATLSNGVRHGLRAGDLIVIPKGEPHWFKAVSADVSYLIIKVQ